MNELREAAGRRVLVQVAGDTISGTCVRAGKTCLLLEDAAALTGETEAPIDGEVFVMLEHVTWMQVV